MPSSGSILTPTVVSVGVAATLLSGASGLRLAAILRNLGDSTGVTVFVGGAGVTIANGTPLENGSAVGRRGDTMTIPGTAAIFAIVAAGTQSVSVLESGD